MIRLRAIDREDLPQLRTWRNALMATGTVRQWRHLGSEDQEAWWLSVRDDKTHIMRAVESCEERDGPEAEGTPRLIGVVGLTYCDWIHHRAEASIYIGDEGARGAGFGGEALVALLNYGFLLVNLHRIYAEIFSHNSTSLGLFEKVGFVREGILREHHYYNGQWCDSVMVGILADEWIRRSK